ncbi:hypothetical protein [Algoriphagus sp.]|uniref:hypothetical protein n=1 Tax=Algoriphagus sp. TaxID=1872435 RepID=UPI00261220DB|nr:hypothetical protein [Algoriphagus sp.]
MNPILESIQHGETDYLASQLTVHPELAHKKPNREFLTFSLPPIAKILQQLNFLKPTVLT